MLPVETPFKIYVDLNGKPLDQGYVYFGQPDQNPITTPVTVYWDAAGTIPAAQPLRTVNGYIMRSGAPANVFFDGAYSELVQDKHRRQIFYARNSDEFSIASAVKKLSDDLAAPNGGTKVGFQQTGLGAVLRNMLTKVRAVINAADYIVAPSVSTALDKAGVLAAATEAAARGGNVVLDAPIGTWDLSSINPPATMMFEDNRYNNAGWKFWHSEGDDAQLGLRGRATTGGEGPSFVLHNLASTGNRNVSFVHWYGPSDAPVVASYEHWGFIADGTWYAGRQWLSKGSIDTGARARNRLGNDGGVIWNPNGDASSFKNNPATGFTQDYLFVFNAPLQSGYTYSGKNLFNIRANSVESMVDMVVQGANPTVRFKNVVGANRFGFIGDLPSAGQFALWDYILDTAKMYWTSGGDTVLAGNFRSASDNVDNLGRAGNRFATIYAGTGTINTSDEREKQQIGGIDAAVLRAWAKVQYCQFKFNDAVQKKGDGARWHVGVIAQRVKAAFESEGIDPFEYGVLCRDDLESGGDRYGIRYEEALVLECAYLRSKIAA